MPAGADPRPAVTVRDATDHDVPAMTAIYNALLATTTIEWTDHLHSVDERAAWQRSQLAAGRPVLVAVAGDEVIGWASYGDFRDAQRWPGYRFTVEHSIHVAESWWGRGVGRLLIEELVGRARAAGAHVMVAGIDGDNTDSISFHERLGFDVVGRLAEIGRKHDRWLDLVLMQRVLADRPVLVVDLGGVACSFQPEVRMNHLVQAMGLPADEIEQRWWGSGLEDQAEVGALDLEQVCARMRDALGVDLADEQLRALWATAFVPDRPVLDLVERVDASRVLFTNNGPLVADGLVHELAEVAQMFDRCVCSCEIGYRKPSTEAFEALARLLDVAPAQMVLVDDNPANGAGASTAGLDAIVFTSAAELAAQLHARRLLH